MLPDERRRLIADRLRQQGSVSVATLEEAFGVSPMTARRDLGELERQGIARRTHGGAVPPGPSVHEDSFFQRMEVEVDAKERLAEAAVALLSPGEAVFVDSSTTGYFAARRIVRQNLRCTLLTNSVPVMDLVCEAEAPQVELIGVGGSLRKLTRSFVGPQALRAGEAHFADHAIFSVRGVTENGHPTDPPPPEAQNKKGKIERAPPAPLLLGAPKVDPPPPAGLAP